MLRLRTNVTASPTVSRRSWSATAATSRKSGPRAPSRVTISSTSTSSPASTPSSTSPTGVRARAVHPGGTGAGSSAGGVASPPAAQASSRARPSRSDAQRTAKRTSSCSQRSPSRTYSGYTVRRGASVLPAASVARRSTSSSWPRPLGVHVVGGDGGDAAPVVDPGRRPARRGRRASDRLGGACRWIDGSSTSRAAAMVHRNSSGSHAGARHIDVPGLGRKFWTITSCTWPWRPWAAAMARSASSRSIAGLADADQDPGGERHPGPARGLERGQPSLGRLVGGAGVRAAGLAETGGQGLDHHPLRRRHRPEPHQLVLGERAGVGVGEQSGLGRARRRPRRRGSRPSRRTPASASQAAASG